jgi:hypothetical protein
MTTILRRMQISWGLRLKWSWTKTAEPTWAAFYSRIANSERPFLLGLMEPVPPGSVANKRWAGPQQPPPHGYRLT